MTITDPVPPDVTGILTALLISLISGFISIAQRIVRGRDANILWVTSEFLSAILCGYLMYDAYPAASQHLPDWVSLPIAVAIAAHMGGRTFQGIEVAVTDRYRMLFGTRDRKR